MKSRLVFLLKYFSFWVIIFLVQKLLFLGFNYKESFNLNAWDWIMVLFKGLPLDFSTAGYLSFIPALLVMIGPITGAKFARIFINIYTYIFLFIVLYLGVVDMDLYSYWGFKLDISPLLYIKTPGEALASVSIFEIVSLLLAFAVLFILFLKFYRLYFTTSGIDYTIPKWKSIPTGLLLAALLFIPVRGGFGIAPMNLGRVYFHHNTFANHSAINVPWNVIYSITKREKLTRQFIYMDDIKADEFFTEIMKHDSSATEPMVKENSNVILIILESFCNKVMEPLGWEPGVTPGLNDLCSHSVVFSNFYANGERSDKAMGAIFSSFPTLPTISILDFPKKVQSLPFIMKQFTERDYETGFYYGGDINFANFKAFFSNESINKLVTDKDFSRNISHQKWGVPDGFLFEKMYTDLENKKGPFFYSCFTLSRHEPFDVPIEPVFGTSSRDDLARTAYWYTDSVLTSFITKARSTSWWDNTLIIIMADHGSRSPGNTSNYEEKKFQIPMIWTGGAILKDTIIDKIGSQTDLAATLLSQFNMDHSEFLFSNDLLDPYAPSFAFYAFNNGFGFKNKDSYVIYDNAFEKATLMEGENPELMLEKGKAYLQKLSNYFISKQ